MRYPYGEMWTGKCHRFAVVRVAVCDPWRFVIDPEAGVFNNPLV